ncbi:MAG: spore coat protein CotJB [Bacillota bacterium]|nr:spore coat protein CotJB [Bacillota bacterium]
MTTEQKALMLQLQQVGLSMDDLRIYLDTHLDDSFAIERFNMAASDYQELMAEYGRLYGPLTQSCPQQGETSEWSWGMTDFPWQY